MDMSLSSYGWLSNSPRTITTSAISPVSDEQIEQARARDIVKVARELGIELSRYYKEFRALCIFHDENTASLDFNAEKGAYLCRGCGATGDVIGLVMKVRNLDFPEAVRWLADEQDTAAASNGHRKDDPARSSLNISILAQTTWRGIASRAMNPRRFALAPSAGWLLEDG